jgi:Skp family chaperone for outer membrane proteins
MKTSLKALASLALASAMAAGHAQTATSTIHPAAKKAAKPAAKPSVESQIESLRQEMNSQIQSLKQQLADRDSQLQQAQQAAAQAQQSAAAAQQAAQAQQAAVTENTQAVNSLQGSVADLKTNTQSLVTTIQDNQTQVKKQIENPDAIRFKGITLSPTGSFIEAATVYRNRALASDINTPFNSIPFEGANNAAMSEFYGTGRQSRAAILAEGKLDNWTLRGYYEADWLGTGVTSNNNESNSYVLRQRQLFAQAEAQSGWIFTAGQQWSLVTQTRTGITNRTELLPQTIDAAYNAGFVWERQYGARIVKNFHDGLWAGFSVENPQTLTPSCAATGTTNAGAALACPTNYLIGAAGTNGGLYNGAGQPGASSSAPVTTYAYNLAPDLIAKVVYEKPGFGHYELFGIARFFRSRVYPNATSTKVPTGTGAYNDSMAGGGIGGSFYVPATKYFDVGLSGLWGDGTNRYGATQETDATIRPDGQLALLHGYSALATAVFHASPRMDVYFNAGADGTFRNYFDTQKGVIGYGLYGTNDKGCGIELAPGTSPQAGYQPTAPANCGSPTKDVQEFTLGYWYDFYRGPKGRFRQGIQYSYLERYGWSGVGVNPKGNDNEIYTSFRYYLP